MFDISRDAPSALLFAQIKPTGISFQTNADVYIIKCEQHIIYVETVVSFKHIR